MRQQLRESGVGPLGDVPWGTHVCHLYANKAELLEVLVPYFVTGLRNHECCIWVCSEPVGVDEAREALAGSLPELGGYLASGQMQLMSFRGWYLDPDGAFDATAVLERWKQKLDDATAAGYDGLRVAGDVSWLDQGQWNSFAEYEGQIYGSIGHDPMLAICSYPRNSGWGPDSLDIIRSHQYALVHRDWGWDLIECARHWEIQWESLFDAVLEGLLLVDDRASILGTNSACLETLGIRSFSELGVDLSDLAARFDFRPDRDSGRCSLQDILTGQSGDAQYWRATSKTAGGIDLRVRAREVTSLSWFSRRFLVVLQDVTDLRAVERAKDEFVHVMSHELRNPIQAMRALVRLMEAEVASGSPAMKRYAASLDGQVSHLSSLVEDLFTACRIDRGGLAISLLETDLVALVQQSIELHAALSGREVIRLFGGRSRVPVLADEVRIRQILANVLDNAVKYTPKGSRIWVDVQVLSDQVIVKVADEGIGIPPGELDRVFEPFYRASNSHDYAAEGAGLGLYISRQLARMHGGDLWAEGRPGGGAVVCLRLPRPASS